MLKLPGKLTPDTFLERHWQKQPLFMQGALQRIRPAITRNELGWLATLDDVESRLVFVDRCGQKPRYRVETGPFEATDLQNLPKRNWTLLVHDVEKHLPAMRALFHHVPFIPEWRIDDLMVSFAAPGGGVGPHRDHYDVFLCQGVGVRNWQFTSLAVPVDRGASDDLALLAEFEGEENHDTRQGDVLYLPPGVAHWGTAKRACITYSIGMRAPQAADLALMLEHECRNDSRFYSDPDLACNEALPGYISERASKRAQTLLGLPDGQIPSLALALGRFATQPKDWLRPAGASVAEAQSLVTRAQSGGRLNVHGMANIAYDDQMIYVNGSSTRLPRKALPVVRKICMNRSLCSRADQQHLPADLLRWMMLQGAFEIPENS